MKINTEEQIIPNDTVISIIASDYSLNLKSWSLVPEGISNVVVLLVCEDNTRYFAKFYKKSHSVANIKMELALIKQLSALDIPVPAYLLSNSGAHFTKLYTGSGDHHFVTITKAIKGAHPTSYSDNTIKNLAHLHGEAHKSSNLRSSRFSALNWYHFATLPKTHYAHDIDQSLSQLAKDLDAKWQSLPNGLVPLDIKRDNVIQSKDSLSIIDFADTNVAPFIFCLGGTLWDIFEESGSRKKIQDYVSSYSKVRPLSYIEQEVLPHVTTLRGWISLHGALITQDDTLAKKQVTFLQDLLKNPFTA